MLKNLTVREKFAKIILILLVVFACITIFPKNFKIAVLNYDGRQSAVVLGDAKTGETKETSYIFGKGNFWVTPIMKGTVKSLYIEDEKEFVDEVTAYYGSVKISKDVQISGNDGELVADITYSIGKIALMVVLYAAFCLTLMTLGILKILKSHISFPEKIEINVDWIDILIFGGISLAYMIGSYIVSMHQLIKWIYPLEIAFSGFMLFVTLCVEKQVSKHRIGTTISALPIGVCLAISINKICAFTFVDGHQAIMEQVNYATDKLRHWEKNSARLNYIIMGTFERFNFIEKLKGETPAKIMHWFFGVVLFVYIVWFITKKLLRNDSNRLKAFQFTAVFCSIFLYNYTLTALKNYNYDLFSITFGAIAFIHMIYAARTHSKTYSISALVFATLGTLEKIIVWPIMLLCMLAYVIISTLGEKKPYLKTIGYTLKAEGIAIVVSACCNLWIQHVVRGDYFPNYRIVNLVKPLQGQMYNVLATILPDLDFSNGYVYTASNFVQILLVLCGYFIVEALYSCLNQKRELFWRVYKLFILLSGLFILYVVVRGAMQNIYYESTSLVVVETSISTLGTTFLVLLLIVCFSYKCEMPHREWVIFLILFEIAIPELYIFVGEYENGRYFNLFNILSVILLDTIIIDIISEITPFKILVVGVMWWICTFIEILPYGPDHFYFRPCWNSNYLDKEYFAGGVERLKIGEQLQRYYQKNKLNDKNVTIYFNYGGDWNSMPEGWKCKTLLSDGLTSLGEYTLDDIEYGEDVYYAFITASVMRERYYFYPMPDENIVPMMSPTVRGSLIGNVYKSEDLRPYFENVFAIYK